MLDCDVASDLSKAGSAHCPAHNNLECTLRGNVRTGSKPGLADPKSDPANGRQLGLM